MTFNDVVSFFNEKNRELRKRIENTSEYKELRGCSDLTRRNELVRTINHLTYEEQKKTNKELVDFLISSTTFKDNSPYICDLSVEVKGQKLMFGNRYSLNGGDVSSMYKDWIRQKNEENKKSVVFNVGDIYTYNNKFYSIKKITDKSVMMDEMVNEWVSSDFNEEDCRNTCLKDENFSMTRGWFVPTSKYYEFRTPNYTINSLQRPTDKVSSTYKMTVVFENGKTILRNKSNCLDITEKYNGEPITVKYRMSDYYSIPNEAVVSKIKEIISECDEKSKRLTDEYNSTLEGKKDREEVEKIIQKKEEENKVFNEKYNEIGVSRDIGMTSMDVFDFITSKNTEKKIELYEELSKEVS